MGIFGTLFELAVDVVTLPVAVVVDTVTLGEAEATKTNLNNIKEDLDNITD